MRKTSNPNSEYLVRLECDHLIAFQRAYLPPLGERLWCIRCRNYRPATQHAGMYRSLCLVRGCKYSRWHGAARLTAQRAADKHCAENAEHVAVVTLGTERISVHGENREQYRAQLALF
jgi:hypothetical protein